MGSVENFRIQIKTLYGFEEILAKEVSSMGGANVKLRNRMVECEGDMGFIYKANYSLRTALRILMPIHSYKASNEDELYQQAYDFPWEDYFSSDKSILIDSTVFSNIFRHSHYAALKVKDAIVDRFRDKTGDRPNVEKYKPDISINLHINQNRISLALDSSGEPLFKRGYRVDAGEAPLNEVLAAGMLQIAGWNGTGHFLDPMCGSGTLCIEAAMLAMNIPSQIHREYFAFKNWKNFDAEFYEKIKQTRIKRIKDFTGTITGYDINMNMVDIAERNIESADLSEFISIKQVNFFQTKKEGNPLLVVFNPPYDERMELSSEDFYRKIGDTLKQNYPHTIAWMITANEFAIEDFGLRPDKVLRLFNGNLECDYVKYEIYNSPKAVE